MNAAVDSVEVVHGSGQARWVRVRVTAGESVTVNACACYAGSHTLVHSFTALAAGDHALVLAVPAGVAAGAASVKLTVSAQGQRSRSTTRALEIQRPG